MTFVNEQPAGHAPSFRNRRFLLRGRLSVRINTPAMALIHQFLKQYAHRLFFIGAFIAYNPHTGIAVFVYDESVAVPIDTKSLRLCVVHAHKEAHFFQRHLLLPGIESKFLNGFRAHDLYVLFTGQDRATCGTEQVALFQYRIAKWTSLFSIHNQNSFCP